MGNKFKTEEEHLAEAKKVSANAKNIANFQLSFLDKLVGNATRSSVSEVFSHLITENEKSNQEKVSGKIDKLGLRAERDEESVQDEQEEVEVEKEEIKTDTSSPKVKAQKLPSAMEADDVTKMLNIIRAGKSLKDPDVQKRFDVWFGALTPPEKIALKGFLDGIAQIISGDIEAEDASRPSAAPYNVEMGANPKEKPRKLQKKSVKIDQDAAGIDSPIIVGEVNSANELKKRMIT